MLIDWSCESKPRGLGWAKQDWGENSSIRLKKRNPTTPKATLGWVSLGQPNLVFNTGFTYAAPQFLKRFDVSTVAEVIPIPIPIPSSPLDALSRVSIGRRISSDGSDTIVTVEPSLTGAVAGAAGGATIGAFTCTTSVVAAPAAPICGAVGGLIGGVVGLVFGPSDNVNSQPWMLLDLDWVSDNWGYLL